MPDLCATIKAMFDSILPVLNDAQKFVIIQAENPDGDSLGSSLALEELLSEAGKDVKLYCAIDIPKYMHYINGWDRVEKDWPTDREVAIIVDTTAEALIQQALAVPGIRHFLETHPVIVIDHHETEGDLPFDTLAVIDPSAVATSEVLYHLAKAAGWVITPSAAESMFVSIQADSLGLSTPSTTAESYQVAADLVKLGAVPSDIENRRREYMKKPADILEYKGKLIERIEYHLDGKLATVHIPWGDIQEYSDRYNPSVLVLEEMRMVEGVEVAVAIKTYPDGKLTGKIRVNAPIAEAVAGYFGGGGHPYAAGFKVFESYDTIISELITATDKALTDYESSIS
jgi:phosphoesterase RecJ-like protein